VSLDYDFSKCENAKDLMSDEEWPITNAIIWGCISTGIGTITKDNADEWYARNRFMDEVYNVQGRITRADVEKRIGLHTNVYPEETRNVWYKRIGRMLDYNITSAKYDPSL
jgi:hypothetical protein